MKNDQTQENNPSTHLFDIRDVPDGTEVSRVTYPSKGLKCLLADITDRGYSTLGSESLVKQYFPRSINIYQYCDMPDKMVVGVELLCKDSLNHCITVKQMWIVYKLAEKENLLQVLRCKQYIIHVGHPHPPTHYSRTLTPYISRSGGGQV